MPHFNDSFRNFFDDFVDRTANPLAGRLRDAVLAASYPGLLDEPHDRELATLLKSPDLKAVGLPPLALAGLWLLAGDLDRSHAISQADSSAEGSFWHGIMHRREADYSNAKYWFRRVAAHPVLIELADHHPGVFSDPYRFIDDVEKACGGRATDPAVTQSWLQVQWTEWQLLMRHCLSVNAPNDQGSMGHDSTGQRSE
ncbi:hypothetical protein [Neorhodopirellula pilleata]|uniref:Uncharacterized protein n=1 Tax=Neorhodopirellula pilleata TaxID=2714738 RepID=A0A5C6A278_9BACT|nr:hypothetical protein [Neorhodopirellula pilleata]TWT93659.1 hypothetical protein Pla100_41770 [Neorhodopirellula pilleata]